jgi:hypothetical protein
MPTKKNTPERYIDILKISKRYLVLLGYPVVREAEMNFENFIICYLEKNKLEIIICLSGEQTSIVINVE